MLITCPECGHNISSYAKVCPCCGGPNIYYLAKRKEHREKKTRLESAKADGPAGLFHAFIPILVIAGLFGISYMGAYLFSDTFNPSQFTTFMLLLFWPIWFFLHFGVSVFEVLFFEIIGLLAGAYFHLPGEALVFLLMILPIIFSIAEFGYGLYLFFNGTYTKISTPPMTNDDLLLEEMEDL